MEALCEGQVDTHSVVSLLDALTVSRSTHTHRLMIPTFSDLPVVAETPAQGHGDGWKVGHVVAVAVHAAVPTGTDRLWGQAGAVEARVRDASTCSPAAVAAREEFDGCQITSVAVFAFVFRKLKAIFPKFQQGTIVICRCFVKMS